MSAYYNEFDPFAARGLVVKAPTYDDVNHYTGKARVKCQACAKVAYRTESKALRAAKKIAARVTMKVYKGRCGHWHLSRADRTAPRRRPGGGR